MAEGADAERRKQRVRAGRTTRRESRRCHKMVALLGMPGASVLANRETTFIPPHLHSQRTA